MSKTFYITTPIYYVNDVPHIGHAYTTIAADVLARFWRLMGRDVFFLTGLDEHGQKVQQAAAKAGIDPQAYCDGMVPRFRELWKRLNISNDAFIRTTDAKHKAIVQGYLQALFDKGLIYKANYTGWYCTFDERFWTEKDVVEGLCPDCKRPLERLSENNYFFRMSQYQEPLINHITDNSKFIRPETRRNEVLGFLQSQRLGDLSISRPKSRLSWGIELPFDESYVTYVWFDALVNYLSALEYLAPPQSFDRFWPVNVHLVGKDILTTHAVYWSTMLMALGFPLPTTIFAHGWWTVNGEKMSKSRGNVVDPHRMIDELGADAFRYFLLREVPFGQDGDFSGEAVTRRLNSDLANGIGNLLSRTLTMIERFSNGTIPSAGVPARIDLERVIKELSETLENKVRILLEDNDFTVNPEFHFALNEMQNLVTQVDIYIDETAPWVLAKKAEDRSKLQTVLFFSAQALRYLCHVLYPFMPHTAKTMSKQLGLELDFSKPLLKQIIWDDPSIPGTKIAKGTPLFPRIDLKPQGAKAMTESGPSVSQPSPSAPLAPGTIATPPATTPVQQITLEEFQKIQLKAAKVLSAERVPRSEKLIKLQVDLGGEQRQVVAGIGKKYAPEELIGRTVVIVANLKPAKLMGVESQGMALAAGDADVLELLILQHDVPPGTKVK